MQLGSLTPCRVDLTLSAPWQAVRRAGSTHVESPSHPGPNAIPGPGTLVEWMFEPARARFNRTAGPTNPLLGDRPTPARTPTGARGGGLRQGKTYMWVTTTPYEYSGANLRGRASMHRKNILEKSG